MKKLVMVIMALAMVAAFIPKAYAAESAQLGLQVTFAVDQDLQRINDLKSETEAINDKTAEYIKCFDGNHDGRIDAMDLQYWQTHPHDFNLDGVVDEADKAFLREALHVIKDSACLRLEAIIEELNRIRDRRPDLAALANAAIDRAEQILSVLRDALTILAQLDQPTISIELNNPSWVLQSVKLGEKRSNVSADGTFMHSIKNTGTVYAGVDIRYGLIAGGPIHPGGYEMGKDTFATYVYAPVDGQDREYVIPPDGQGAVGLGGISAGNTIPLKMTYCAPTEVSQPVAGMSVTYEIRAYGEITKQ